MKHCIFFLLCVTQASYPHITRETVVEAYKKAYELAPSNQPVLDRKDTSQNALLYALAIGVDILSTNGRNNVFLIKCMVQEKAKNSSNTLLYYKYLGPYAHIKIEHKGIINALHNIYTHPCRKEQILGNFAAYLAQHSIRIENLNETMTVWIVLPLLKATIKSCIRDRSFHRFRENIVYEVGKTALWKISHFVLYETGFYDLCHDLFAKKSSHSSYFLYTNIYDMKN